MRARLVLSPPYLRADRTTATNRMRRWVAVRDLAMILSLLEVKGGEVEALTELDGEKMTSILNNLGQSIRRSYTALRIHVFGVIKNAAWLMEFGLHSEECIQQDAGKPKKLVGIAALE